MQLKPQPFRGVYRRLIDLQHWDDHTVVGWLEDDFHHFGMTLVHNGTVVTDVRIAEPRHPWTACPSAIQPLMALKGVPLFGRCSEIGTHLDMNMQCTHLGDLAALLMAHAYHQRTRHRYHAQVARLDDVESAAPAHWLRGSLQRDDLPVLQWDVNGPKIIRPEPAAGHSIQKGFREWTETLGEMEAEHAWVLRRAVFVSLGYLVVLDQPYLADEMPLGAVCHNYQPEQRTTSRYLPDSRHKFDQGPQNMLAWAHTRP